MGDVVTHSDFTLNLFPPEETSQETRRVCRQRWQNELKSLAVCPCVCAEEIDALAQAQWMLVGLGVFSCYFPMSRIVCQNEIKIQLAAEADMAEAQQKMLRALPKRLHTIVRQAISLFGAAWLYLICVFVW